MNATEQSLVTQEMSLMTSPWTTGRAPLRTAKKDAVLVAAARLFTQRGFQATSLDDVARSLGITKPTLYYYIDNKEQILFECVERSLKSFRDGLSEIEANGLTGRDQLSLAMRLYAKVACSEFGQCAIRLGEDGLGEASRATLRDLKGQFDTEFRNLIETGMAQGWIAQGDIGSATFAVVGALSGVGRWYRSQSHSAQALEDAIQHCLTMLMHGVLEQPLLKTPSADREQGSRAAKRRENHFQNRMMRCYADRPRNVAEMIATTLQQNPDGQALICGDQRLTWRELHNATARCANGLLLHGVQPGDRVALHMGNIPEFVIMVLGCSWMGAIIVPIGERAGADDLLYTLADSGAVAMVCSASMVDLQPSLNKLPEMRLRFVVSGPMREGFLTFSSLMQVQPLLIPHQAAEDDLAALLYTSGTTGRPKGVMLCHLNIVHSVMHFTEMVGITSIDRSVAAVPLFHVTGLVAQLYTMLYCKACMILMPHFKAADFVRLASAERMTHTILVPAMYNLCLLLPDLETHDLSHWRVGAYGGAAMPTATIDGMAARLPKLMLMNAYGATETCSPATLIPAGGTPLHRDSVGMAVPCADICIVDDQGRELPIGSVGEIWISGPMVVPGYWRNVTETNSEFRGGFWCSGDIGKLDADGYLYLLDRRNDVVHRGGFKIFGSTVENALCEHPDVLEAAVIGVPCSVLGERVHAFVTTRGLQATALMLQKFCTDRLADYAIPETWSISTTPLPRNSNGKVIKRELRQTLHAALN